jgi:hypothetical protein
MKKIEELDMEKKIHCEVVSYITDREGFYEHL